LTIHNSEQNVDLMRLKMESNNVFACMFYHFNRDEIAATIETDL